MGREAENYRPYMEQIKSQFPSAEVLSKAQVAQFLGCSERTVQRKLVLVDGATTRVQLARWMCKTYG